MHDTNPFNFQPHGLNRLEVTIDGKLVPAGMVTVDFAKSDLYEAYMTTLEGLEMDIGKQTCLLTPERFASGMTLYAFKILPGPMDNNAVGAPVGHNLSIKFTFAEPTKEVLSALVFMETNAVFELNALNTPIIS